MEIKSGKHLFIPDFRILESADMQVCVRKNEREIYLLQFVQLRHSSSQTKNFAKAVVNMADAVRALFVWLQSSY